jgi:hypothetical protein
MTPLSLFLMKSDDLQFHPARVAENSDSFILEVIYCLGS